MARVLVIGGNGFIGSHLVDRLTMDGHRVRVFDRFSAGVTRYQSEAVERMPGDFLNEADLRAALDEVDYVYHFLSTTTPLTAQRDPLMDLRTNVPGSIGLFQSCCDAGVKHVYFASSGGAIYGNTAQHVVDEEAPARPISPYAIGKYALENYLQYFWLQQGLSSTSFRISNPYGPRQPLGRRQGVIPIFLDRVRRGEPLQILGEGDMIRDYVYVEDLANMIVRASDHRPGCHVYNVGSGVGSSIMEVVQLVRSVTGLPVELEHRPVPPTYVRRIVLGLERYRATFGPPPEMCSLHDGMLLTWEAMCRREGR